MKQWCYTTAHHISHYTVGLLGKISNGPAFCVCTGVARWMVNVSDVIACFSNPPVYRVSRPQQHYFWKGHVTQRSSHRTSTSTLSSAAINSSLLLEPIIRQAQICETEGKWQKWNPAPATHGCIKADSNPANTSSLYLPVKICLSFSHLVQH